MGSLSNRQSIIRPTSGRAAVAQQGLAQHVTPRPVSARFLASHLGVGRARAASVDVLHRHLPAPVGADVAQFYRLRAEAQRVQQQLAARDRRRSISAKEAGYPAPFLSPAQQRQFREDAQAREREKQRLLAEVNRALKGLYSPMFLRPPAKKQAPPRPTGSDALFMPTSFWHTQYTPTPAGWKSQYVKATKNKKGKLIPAHWTTFDHWRDCCNTCKRLIKKELGQTPDNQIQVVKEIDGANVLRKAGSESGYQKLDAYMALHKPVMVGVSFALGATYNKDKTTEHFVVLVGAGMENGRKYYRFFDVGTEHVNKGTNPKFKLYYNPKTGFCIGEGLLGTYTLSQIRY